MYTAFLQPLLLDMFRDYPPVVAYSLRRLTATALKAIRVRSTGTKTGNVTNTSATIASVTTTGLLVGNYVSGTGIQADSKILSIDSGASTITLDKTATASNNGVTLTFERDIGFSHKFLDLADLLSFCGTNSGFVVTWYDQSKNGNNVTQATTSRQPRIVNAGVVDVNTNGIPSMLGISANDTLLSCPYNSSFDISTNMTLIALHDPISTGGGGLGRIVSKNDTTDYGFYVGSAGVMRMSATTNSVSTAYALATTNLSSAVVTGNSTADFYYQGASAGQDTIIQATAIGNNSLNLFNRSIIARGYDGYLNEVIILPYALPLHILTKATRNICRFNKVVMA